MISRLAGERCEPGTNPNFEYVLNAIKANSPTDVWAVGEAFNAAQSGSGTTLIEHYDGKAWSIVPSPSPGTGDVLTGVTTSNASNNVWAVGYYTPAGSSVAQTLTLNWKETRGARSPAPTAAPGQACCPRWLQRLARRSSRPWGTPASTRHSTRWSCRTDSQAEPPPGNGRG